MQKHQGYCQDFLMMQQYLRLPQKTPWLCHKCSTQLMNWLSGMSSGWTLTTEREKEWFLDHLVNSAAPLLIAATEYLRCDG